jgi:NAD(P)-dependent dehydrogenase (short-subunit alcohol dehydrogenase family)
MNARPNASSTFAVASCNALEGNTMTKAILIGGYGPGISHAVAKRFGREGFSVALVGRSEERLEGGVRALGDAGVVAKAFPCDLGSPDDVRALVRNVRASLGPLDVVHWNALARVASDLLVASTEETRAVFDVAIHGLVAAVQEALSDLKERKGAILVTGGGLALYDSQMDVIAARWGTMGLAVAKAAQHKLVGVFHQKLAEDGVYVGGVTVRGLVTGTPSARGGPGLDPADIAEAFHRIWRERTDVWVSFP